MSERVCQLSERVCQLSVPVFALTHLSAEVGAA
eukprot:COSAG01_NODE_42618_length_438_cov_0.778761_1_plen_32_part_10